MVALCRIESFYRGMIVRTSTFDQNPDLYEIVTFKQERIQRAGKLLAVSILLVDYLADARLRYRNVPFDPNVKVEVDKALIAYDSDYYTKPIYSIEIRKTGRG